MESVYYGPINEIGLAETVDEFENAKLIKNLNMFKKGIMVFERGQGRYFGEWKNGRYEGIGCYSYKDGINYEGAFLNGLMHGHGKFQWPKSIGFTFIGEFKNDKRVQGRIYD